MTRLHFLQGFLTIGLCVLSAARVGAAEPRLQTDLDNERVAILKEVIEKPLLASLKADDEWAEDAKALAPIAIWHMQHGGLDLWSGPREVHDLTKADELSKRILATGCDNPYALAIAAWIAGMDGTPSVTVTSSHYQRAIDSCERHKAHPLVRFLLTTKWVARRDLYTNKSIPVVTEMATRLPALAVAVLESGVFKEKDRAVLAELVFRWTYHNTPEEPKDDVAAAVRACAAAPEWFKFLIEGRSEIRAAWASRGTGWARDTTPEQFAGFFKHLDLAAKALTKAHELQPDLPHAAGLMITVEMGRSDNAACWFWFTKAMEGQIDHPQAWRAIREAMSPRWAGSNKALFTIASAALETNRFDTRVPWNTLETLERLAEDDFDAFRSRASYKLIKEMCDGYRKEAPAAIPANFWDSLEAGFACQAGEYAVANALFEKIGDNVNHWAFSKARIDADLARMKSAALGSEAAPALQAAMKLDAAEEFQRAADGFSAAMQTLKPGSEARRYADFRKRLSLFHESFHSGKQTPLLQTGGEAIWLSQDGSLTIAPENRIIIRAADATGWQAICRTPTPTKGNFVVRGRIIFKTNQRMAIPEVAVLIGANAQTTHAAASVGFNQFRSNITVGRGTKFELKAIFEDVADFEIRIIKEKLILFLNGQQVSDERPLGYLKDTQRYIGLRVPEFKKVQGAEVTIENLTVQRLDAAGSVIEGVGD